MAFKIFRILAAEFIGEDEKVVEGKYVYLIPAKDGVDTPPERVFLSDARLAQMGYKPVEGDAVYVFRNGFGKVMDMLKA